MWRILREQRGSQIVEFTLIVPILLYLVFSVPTIGFAVRTWLVLEVAAREGARHLALTSDIGGARERAFEEVTRYGGLPVRFNDDILFAANNEFIQVVVEGDVARVTVAYYQPVSLPGMGFLLSGTGERHIRLQGASSFRLEYLSP